jgi:signal transduction histidine kinase
MTNYKILFEKSPFAILIFKNGILENANAACYELWKSSKANDLVGKSITDFFIFENHDFKDDANAEFFHVEHFNIEAKILAKDAQRPDILFSNVIVHDHENIMNYVTVLNVSERKKHETTIIENEQKLRQLSNHVEEVREAERTKIAQEIHDDLGNTLTVLKMEVFWLIKQLPTPTAPISNQLDQKIKGILEHINQAIETTRNLITQLRPSVLDNLGLLAAIEWQINKFQKTHDITCLSELPENQSIALDRKCNTVVFRVLQEALNNVVKHSKANEVRVRIVNLEQFLIVKIIDNGIGMNEDEINRVEKYGLRGMCERINFCGGDLAVFSEIGKGTMILLKIPKQN